MSIAYSKTSCFSATKYFSRIDKQKRNSKNHIHFDEKNLPNLLIWLCQNVNNFCEKFFQTKKCFDTSWICKQLILRMEMEWFVDLTHCCTQKGIKRRGIKHDSPQEMFPKLGNKNATKTKNFGSLFWDFFKHLGPRIFGKTYLPPLNV